MRKLATHWVWWYVPALVLVGLLVAYSAVVMVASRILIALEARAQGLLGAHGYGDLFERYEESLLDISEKLPSVQVAQPDKAPAAKAPAADEWGTSGDWL